VPRTAAGAPRPAAPRGCASHGPGNGARPSGTRLPARTAAGGRPPGAARPGHDGGRRVQETAAHNTGSAPAPRPRARPPARRAAARGRPHGIWVGRRGSGRSPSAGASGDVRWVRRGGPRGIGRVLAQPGFQLADARLQDNVLRAQPSILPSERRQLLQERRVVRSRGRRAQLGPQRQSRLDHAAVVTRRSSRGKPANIPRLCRGPPGPTRSKRTWRAATAARAGRGARRRGSRRCGCSRRTPPGWL
jgi:hypothetical protein